MARKAQPIFGQLPYIDVQSGLLTPQGVQAFGQHVQAVNSIPISISGEQVAGAGTHWMLAHQPAGSVMLQGVTAGGVVALASGKGNTWNYTIAGAQITTAQGYVGLIACYEYLQ